MNTPTPFDAFFDALSTALQLPCPREPHADAATSTETRIVWTRSGAPKPEPIPYRRSGAKIIARLAHPWTATIYAETDAEVCTILANLWGAVDELLGPAGGAGEVGVPGDPDHAPERPGYVFAAGKVEPRGDDAAAASWACDVAVTLHQPVASQLRPPATITSVTITATAAASADASAASLVGET